jgi:hypothetical protein
MINSTNSYEERIFCPKCIEPIDLSINKSKKSTLETELNEFTKLSCKKCSLEFTFIYCEFCQNKKFMKIHPTAEEYNGLDGFNIRCPYQSCQNVFYFTVCMKCHRAQKQRNQIKEGQAIKCIYKDCNCQYIQTHTPKEFSADIINIEKPKHHSNFPIGIMFTHKKEILYQKISCYYCSRPIVFSSTREYRNQYWEGQKVECPYQDCKKAFNRIICPFCCEEIYINDGWYEMGSIIKCNFCKKTFGKILCPSCQRMNVCDKKFKLGLMNCGFNKCLNENVLVNCVFCRKMNIFEKNTSINGQTIKCGYCKNTFNEILCPYCREINAFPLADFSFGKLYKCQYLTCLKEFQFLICPKCLTYTYTNDRAEGISYKCDKCQVKFMNFGCPFCKSNIIIQSSSFKIGQMIRCPSEKCHKIYSFISCSKCQKLIFSKENENFCGKAVKCPYQNCKSYTLMLYCPLCEVRTIYTGKKSSLNEGESICCENCKKNYIFQKNNLLYQGNLKVLEQIEGRKIDFGVGQVDDNYLAIQELFFDDVKYKCPSVFESEYSDQVLKEKNNIVKNFNTLGECIVCHNNLKESVFVLCGHRCVCYNCAVIVFAVTKRCPKCDKEASCIIKKIYE